MVKFRKNEEQQIQLRDYLKDKVLIMDGAMGTYYARKMNRDSVISEYANVIEPTLIKEIHKEYIKAGSCMIRTNTFAVNRKVMSITKEQQVEMIEAACKIAQLAVKECRQEGITKKVWIAGSIGPIPVRGDYKEKEICEEYIEIAKIMIQSKVDVILFETFEDTTYILPALEYIRENSECFIMANFALNRDGYTQTGVSAQRLMKRLSSIEAVDACGFNCGVGSGHMLKIVQEVNFPEDKFISILPNSGYPEQVQSRMFFLNNAKYFSETMNSIIKLGVNIVGGCCGTTPEYIEKLAYVLKQNPDKENRQIEVLQPEEKQEDVKENDLLKKMQLGKKVIAVELDPPYDADCEKVISSAKALQNIDIITMADSPRGRSRVDSILMCVKLAKETGHQVMPHICCRDKNMIAMRSSLLGAYIHGIRNSLIVTGDPVPSVSRVSTTSVFDYNSIQLMNFVKEMNEEHFKNDPIVYGGALNQGRGRIDKITERMEKKIEAGASYFLTQPIYSEEDIERIALLKQKVDCRILCGIMPLVSYRNANFIKNELSGVNVPDWIMSRYQPDMSREDAEWVGAEIAGEIIAKLSDISDGYYFMLPFNRVSLMDKINMK